MDLKKEAARVAYTLVKNNSSVGVGDGSTVRHLAAFLIDGISQGLKVSLYTSSFQTEQFLREAGMTVLDISSADRLDQYFDGCDQVDKQLNVIKSGAGIHTQEKLLASMADKCIILAEESKFVSAPDAVFPLVLEVLPQAIRFVKREMMAVYPDAVYSVRQSSDKTDAPLLTRNGNYLLDCRFAEWPPAENIQNQSKRMTGVVDISLFYRIVDEAIIAGKKGVYRYQRINEQIIMIGSYPLESNQIGMNGP